MEVHIRKLDNGDLEKLTLLAKEKTAEPREGYADFAGIDNDTIFHLYVLPDDVKGSGSFSSFGYFVDGQLVAAIGVRSMDLSPAWVLSFIVTHPDCVQSILAIRDLVNHTIAAQEARGYHQWFVVSANKRFSVWQRLFKHVRSRYHHYTYAVVEANQPPKFLDLLDLTGKKIFPYDITISMYVSKEICTSL